MAAREADDSDSLPSELPLSPDGGSLPSELPLSPDGGLEPSPGRRDSHPEVSHAVAEAPASERAIALAPLAAQEIRLVPTARGGRGRGGRGVGRPRRQLVSLTGGRADPVEAAAIVIAGPEESLNLAPGVKDSNTEKAMVTWLDSQQSVGMLKQQAFVAHGFAGLGPPIVRLGFGAPLADNQALVAALVQHSGGVPDPSTDLAQVVDFVLGKQQPPVVSLTGAAMATGVVPKKIPGMIAKVAAAMYMLGQARLSRLETVLLRVVPRECLVHYIEVVQYDETELQVRVVGDPQRGRSTGQVANTPRGAPAIADRHSGAMVTLAGQKSTLKVYASQSKQKVMQTQSQVGLVVRLGERLVTLVFRSPCPLAVLERATAACITEAQLRLSKASRASLAFGGMTRVATTDGPKSNIATEAAIAGYRGGGDGFVLHMLCDTHCTALVYAKTLAPLDDQVSGAIRVALSLRTGSSMTRLRECLRDEIESRLVIRHGVAPASAVDYKKKVLTAFAAHGPGAPTRRALLALCANGDWRSEQVEYYAQEGGPPELKERKNVVEHVANGLIVALASSQPAAYNRSKWTGSDLAIDDLGIFESVHCLLSTTFARFCASYLKGDAASKLLTAGAALRQYDHAPASIADEDEDQAAAADGPAGEGVPAAANEGAQQPVQAGPIGAASVEPDWAAINAADRKKGMVFVGSGCLKYLTLIRWLMEPLRQYLDKQFQRVPDMWRESEKARIAQALKRGAGYFGKLRIVQVADGQDDRDFSLALKMLFESSELWSVMPPSGHTVSMRALGFRCASRMGCAFAKLCSSRHQRFPWQLFRLLSTPSLAQEFRDMKDCLLDDWTKAMRKRWPNFEGDEFLQVLYSVACLMKTDIVNVEARHAAIRRFLTVTSVQTHATSMMYLSAMWMFQQFRTQRMRGRDGAANKHKRKPARRGGDGTSRRVRKRTKKGQATQRAGFGGAWRAWVRTRCAGVPRDEVDMAKVAMDYHEAKAQRSAEYCEARRLGQIASAIGRRPGASHGFGGVARRARLSIRRLARVFPGGADPTNATRRAEDAVNLVARSLVSGASVTETLSVARYSQRLEASGASSLRAEEREALENFEAGAGREAVDALCTAYPELAALPMVGEPTNFGMHVRVDLPSDKEVQRAVEWALVRAKNCGLSARLEEQWSQLLRPVQEPHGVVPPPQAPVESKCIAAGMCICSEQGQEIAKRVIRFYNYLKLVCRTRQGFRKDLGEGFLIVRLIGEAGSYEEMFDDDGGQVDTWLHIGLMYWNPYEPTFMVVNPTEVTSEVQGDHKRVYVQSAQEYHLVHRAFAPLAKSGTISAKWYRLEEGERPIGKFALQPVPALLLRGFEDSRQFWPRRVGARRQPRVADPGLIPILDRVDVAGVLADAAEEADEDIVREDVADDDGLLDLFQPLLDAYVAPVDFAVNAGAIVPLDAAEDPVRAEPVAADLPPPPDPLPLPAPAQGAKRRRVRADPHQTTIVMEGGGIAYYESNNNFEAKCLKHFGERCTWTKGAHKASGSGGESSASGRPLGLLAAWLAAGAACDTKREHKDKTRLVQLASEEFREVRVHERQVLTAAEGSEFLLSKERPPLEGEGEEPQVVV